MPRALKRHKEMKRHTEIQDPSHETLGASLAVPQIDRDAYLQPAAPNPDPATVALLEKAAYITLYSMPDPNRPDAPSFSMEDLGFPEISVNEQVHRFPIDLASGDRVGEHAADIRIHWIPAPEDFDPAPGRVPPHYNADPTRSQNFVVNDARLLFQDAVGSSFRAGGHGRTFPRRIKSGEQTMQAAVVSVLEGFGQLKDMQGTGVINGHIAPPQGLSLCIVLRFMDITDRLLSAANLAPLKQMPNPDADHATLMVIATQLAAHPAKLLYDSNGNVEGWEARECLHLVDTDFNFASGIQCSHTRGIHVGDYTTTVHFSTHGNRHVPHLTSSNGIVRLVNLKGREIGRIAADLFDGDAFPADLPGANDQAFYRFGGFGPIDPQLSTGIFAGIPGMMSVNGAFSLAPFGISKLHVFRIYDPGGAIRSELRRAWTAPLHNAPLSAPMPDEKCVHCGQKYSAAKETDRQLGCYTPERFRASSALRLTAEDEKVLQNVEESLANGLHLYRWWQQKHDTASLKERFDMVRSYNPADSAYGFFDDAELPAKKLPVMGCYQQMTFDRPGVDPRDGFQSGKDAYGPDSWLRRCDQIREYVMGYFLRTTDFQVPVACGPGFFQIPLLSTPPDPSRRGFGYRQAYFKLMDGKIGKFAAEDQHGLVDLRQLGQTFQWIVLGIEIAQFQTELKPFGENGPQLVIPGRKDMWLVISRDFLVDEPARIVDGKSRGGIYGVGYAVVKPADDDSLLAFGPGRFDAGFESMHFDVSDDGEVSVRMGFAVNRPTKIMNIPIDPLKTAVRIGNQLSFGLAGQMVERLEAVLPSFLSHRGFDPVQAFIAGANLLTLGEAGVKMGVSLNQLMKDMLVTHFVQHYHMFAGALETYRSVADWTKPADLPEWIRTGVMPWTRGRENADLTGVSAAESPADRKAAAATR